MDNKTKGKKDYIKLVAELSGREYTDVEKEMNDLKRLRGITHKEFYQHRMWEYSVTQQHIRGRRISRNKERREDSLRAAAEYLGITKAEVRQKIKEINEKGIFRMTVYIYGVFEVFRYKEEELDAVLHKFARRRELRISLQEKLKLVDEGVLQYADLDLELKELYEVFDELMPQSYCDKLAHRLSYSRPDLMEPERAEELHAVVVDMAVTRFLLGFTDPEYVSFHFVGKTLEEKDAFVRDVERMNYILSVNDAACFDYLDDKYQTYSLLKKYYRRKAIFITSDDDYNKFRRFCFGRKKAVIKPYCESMGRGIRPIDLHGNVSCKKIVPWIA